MTVEIAPSARPDRCVKSPSCALAKICAPSSDPCAGRPAKPSLEERIRDHPCYSEQAHHRFARIHLPVAPACNVQCNYCNRKYDCSNESRPGVTSRILTPGQASRKVWAVSKRLPNLSVVGIAGPGDALANAERTFATFRMIRDHSPDLKLCLSTNGLALVDHIEAIKQLGIDHVTVTLNAIDPMIAREIYAWVRLNGRTFRGQEAAERLIDRQMRGLAALRRADILVKINSVMIPGINDDHLKAVHSAVEHQGAFLHNVVPLISDPAHGTAFALAGLKGPRPQDLTRLQNSLGGSRSTLRLMRHCRQCRADAVGLLGEDCTSDLELEALPACSDPAESRARYRAAVAAEKRDKAYTSPKSEPETDGEICLVAVAAKGGERINLHFGKARTFAIYAVGEGGVRLIGYRSTDRYCTGDPAAQTPAMTNILDALNDCAAVFVAKIGTTPARHLREAGLEPVQDYAFQAIETALNDWFTKQKRTAARLRPRTRSVG